MVQGTNSLFRDAKNRSAIRNTRHKPMFIKRYFSLEKALYAHHRTQPQT
ncbi:conserved hypothetical protein [Burkholderia vietnamiensis]|nr:conserved hypothetical protein [Burkholderia vietnamiensis]